MNFLKSWLWLWVIAACLCCYIRLYPLRAHIWDPTHDQASLAVVYNIKKNLLEQIHAKAPQIPFGIAQQLASQQLNEALHKDSVKAQEAIERVNQQMFRASNAKPNIYLLESDPYYYYYLTENILNTGRIAKEIKGSKYYEPLMTAPFGFWQPMTYHPYVGFFIYKIFKILDPNISLMAAVAYTPIIIMCLVLAAFFLLCYTLKVSAYASFIAGLFFVMAPVILKRSSIGWYDTDPYNLLFPLLLLTILLKAITQYDLKHLLRSAILFALVMTGFASIWQGWGFMLVISLAILAICGGYSFLIRKNNLSIHQYSFLALFIIVSTLLGISLLFSFGDFFNLIKEGLGELLKFTVKGLSLWPNLFMEVGELKRASTQDIIADSGGILFLLTGTLSLLYSLWQAFRNPLKEQTLRIIALTTFFISCVLLTIQAERFDIFALLGLALFLSIGLNAFFEKLSLSNFHWITPAVVILLTFFIFINAQKNIRITLTPIFNSTWEKALIDIKNLTPVDSIINGWWPPGHFIKAIAQRRVMFDGATLGESATGYWMANILLNENEDEAAGLLRMINLSGNKTVDFLTSKKLKTSEAVTLVSTIASKSDFTSTPLLRAILNKEEDVQTVLNLTRGGFPHSYILLYNELVDQNIGLTFMGRWNIQKIEKLNENPKLLASIPSRNTPAYIDFLWQLAGGQTHYSPPLSLINQDEKIIYFSENLEIDKQTMKAAINSPTYGKGFPTSIVYLDNQKIAEKINLNANLKYSVVLYSQDGQMMARLMDRSLANSLLIKLFYFNAAGLKHFKSLTSANDMTGRTQIKVFETNWN